MDPSSNIINSSEFSVDIQLDQSAAKNFTHMDAALYKAAARGKIEEFNNYQGFALESLRTPSHNTVLHVFLANYGPFDASGSDNKFWKTMFHVMDIIDPVALITWADSLLRCFLGTPERNGKSETSFIQQILIKCPSLLLEPNAKGQTPLHIAARYGHSAIVKFLINYDARAVREMLGKIDKESNTTLHVAAQYGHFQVVQELVKFEDPDFLYSANRNQETPLYIAARRRDPSLLAIMLDKFKSAGHGGPYGRTVLHAAAMARDAEATRIILDKKENLSLTKETDENGQTPLHYAAHLGHYSVVKELLKWDKSAAYVADEKWEMTALLMAARQGHSQIVREIISCCPDCCEIVDKRGWNLLHFSAFRGRPRGLRLFLSGDSEIRNISEYASIRDLTNKKDELGITPEQVFAAYLSGLTLEATSLENNLSTRKMKEIMELLEDIVKEEVAEEPVRPIGYFVMWCSMRSMKEAKEAHLVVAALIATVTFTAAIAVPGGYKSEKGPGQGTPFLIRNPAFTAFVISDALAFAFSLAAVAIHFIIAIPFYSRRKSISFGLATEFIAYAVLAIVIAFSTGTYAVLRPSPLLATTSFGIGLIFPILLLLINWLY